MLNKSYFKILGLLLGLAGLGIQYLSNIVANAESEALTNEAIDKRLEEYNLINKEED